MDTCLGVPSDQEGRRGQGGVLSERTSTVDGEEAPLHSSAVLPWLRAATTGLVAPLPASSNFGERPFLPGMPNLEASGPAPAQLTSQLAPSSSPRPSSHPLPPHSHRAPSSQSNLRPQALAANSISPRPKASPGKTQGGPQPRVSHHRGAVWAGKRKYGSARPRDACPFARGAAAVSASTSGRTISVRTGEEFPSDVRISGTISYSDRWDL